MSLRFTRQFTDQEISEKIAEMLSSEDHKCRSENHLPNRGESSQGLSKEFWRLVLHRRLSNTGRKSSC